MFRASFLLGVLAVVLQGQVSAFSGTHLLSWNQDRLSANKSCRRPFAGAALSAYTTQKTGKLAFGKSKAAFAPLAERKDDSTSDWAERKEQEHAVEQSQLQSAEAAVPLSPSQYLAALKPICNELGRQGHKLFWVGASPDTLSQALAVQLHSQGVLPSGYSFAAAASPGGIDGTFPEAARQIRVDLLRFITSNHRKLGELHPDDVELSAAANRYGVKIICYEVEGGSGPAKVVFDPPEGFTPRATLRISRIQGHYLSTLPLSPGEIEQQSAGSFANIADDEAVSSLRQRCEALGFSPEAPQDKAAPKPAASARDQDEASPLGAAEEQGEDFSVQVVGTVDSDTVREALECYLSPGRRLEMLPLDRRQDFANALAKGMHAAKLPLQTSAVGTGKPGEAPLAAAARIARSDLIMFTAGHPRIASAPEHAQHPLAAAAKYRISIEVIAASPASSSVSCAVYHPPAGVVPRGTVQLACDTGVFLATVAEGAEGDAVEQGEGWVAATRSLPAMLREREAARGGAPLPQGGGSGAEDEEVEERGERRVVWDPRTLSWQVAYGNAPAASPYPTSSPSAGGGASSFLPRFSKHHKNANAAAGSGPATVGDARLGASLAARNGAGGVINFGGMGGVGEFVPSEGFEELEGGLQAEGLELDKSEGACNLYLALAKLLKQAGMEVQGVMFTAFGDQEGALVGALSRKARLDIRRYTMTNMDQFQEMGRWPGDHDLAAAASVYRVRVVVHMIVFDKALGAMKAQRHAYEPVTPSEAQGELHLCLDKGRFWPIYAASTPEGAARTAAFRPSAPPAPPAVLPKPRSALEKVWADFGGRGKVQEMVRPRDPEASKLAQERDWMAGAESLVKALSNL